MSQIKQVIILAGGKGIRMREMTHDLPKPMVKIGDLTVLDHLINIFQAQGEFEFVICTGYLGEVIEEYFRNKSGVQVVFTGDETNTGGRLYKVRDLLDKEFIITYGDGLANVDINNLIEFHNSHNKIGSITVTNPISRFGLVNFNKDNIVTEFVEKPKLEGFINIGFMIFKNSFINYLDENSTLESEPLKKLSGASELCAFNHSGYFEPMDTYREYLHMNELWKSGKAPWLIND